MSGQLDQRPLTDEWSSRPVYGDGGLRAKRRQFALQWLVDRHLFPPEAIDQPKGTGTEMTSTWCQWGPLCARAASNDLRNARLALQPLHELHDVKLSGLALEGLRKGSG